MYKLASKRNIILILVILLAAFLRFFKLSEIPITLNHDEISQLYDGASIIQTKKDIYGNFLPLVFPSTGDFKIGYYTYLSTISYLLFGGREVAIRIPVAFFGTLSVLGVFLFIKALTKNWTIAVLSAFLVALTPSEIFYSRKSFESIMGVCFVFFGFYFLLKNLEAGKRKWGFIAVLLFALAMYIYTSYAVVVPLLLILFFIFFKNKIIEQRKNLIVLFITLAISLIPLFYINFTNPNVRFRGVTVFIGQDPNLGRLISLTGNSAKSYFDFIFIKYLNQLDPTYLFINGLGLTNQGLYDLGPLLLWQLPLFLLGIMFIIKNKNYTNQGKFLLAAALAAMIPSAITFEDYSPHRAILAFAIMSIISGFGLYWLINIISSYIKNSRIKILIFGILLASLVVNFIYAARIYIVSYPFEKSEKMQYPFKQVILYAWSQINNFDSIVFDPQFGEINPIIGVGVPYYIGYYGNIPAGEFQKKYKLGIKPREVLFDKFSIRQVIWGEDHDLKNTLLVASPWSIPLDQIKPDMILKRFNFYNGSPAFYAIKL